MSRLASLTPQQVRVLMMLSEGLLNKQIAYELGVSEATVKAHVSAILQKLGVESRTQAVIAASKIELGQWPQTANAGLVIHGIEHADPLLSIAWLPVPRHSAAATRCTAPLREQRAQRRRLDRLVEHLDAVRPRLLAHVRAPVGGDEDGREVGAESPPQWRDRLDAVAVVEVVIYQKAVGRYFCFRDDRQRRLEIRGLEDPAAPAAQQRFHAIENREVVVDAQHGDAGELHVVATRGPRWMLARRDRRRRSGTSTENREPRPTAEVTEIL